MSEPKTTIVVPTRILEHVLNLAGPTMLKLRQTEPEHWEKLDQESLTWIGETLQNLLIDRAGDG